MALVKRGKDLWFYEDLYSDVTYGFKVKRVVVPEKLTGFQKLMILDTERFGRVLVLDGIVQLTEEDEGIYHEWIAHWPIFALNRPAKHVLIIGGGDCGVAREVLRHRSVQKVTMVEIDRLVCDLTRQYMPSVCAGVYEDPRFKLIAKILLEQIGLVQLQALAHDGQLTGRLIERRHMAPVFDDVLLQHDDSSW